MAVCAGLGEEGVTKVFPDLEGPGKTPLPKGQVHNSPE